MKIVGIILVVAIVVVLAYAVFVYTRIINGGF